MEKKRIRKKKTLSSFAESEEKLLERLRKMKEEKKKYIADMFSKLFSEILNDDSLLEILDENKENKNFQEDLSNRMKEEILKHKNSNIFIEGNIKNE